MARHRRTDVGVFLLLFHFSCLRGNGLSPVGHPWVPSSRDAAWRRTTNPCVRWGRSHQKLCGGIQERLFCSAADPRWAYFGAQLRLNCHFTHGRLGWWDIRHKTVVEASGFRNKMPCVGSTCSHDVDAWVGVWAEISVTHEQRFIWEVEKHRSFLWA